MSLLGIGITGKSLTDLERTILSDCTPYAVILFGRNVGDPQQLRELIREVKSIGRPAPLVMIDEEGGRVDRLRNLIPGLPAPEAFGESTNPRVLSSRAGTIIGRALRYFDIEVNLAPVVDVAGAEAPKGLERRMFGRDAETVTDFAGAFMHGLHSSGVAACLKHFPGIGSGSADPHYGATVIDVSQGALAARDLVPFTRLGNEAGAIMVGHGTYPRIDAPDLPATLSSRISTNLLRETAGFNGVAITDDMEMHAVSDLASFEAIAVRALMAGNDVLMYCSQIERAPEIHRFLELRSRNDNAVAARAGEAARRGDQYRHHSDALRHAAPPPAARFEQVAGEAARFVEEFTKARLTGEAAVQATEPRAPGRGRTGREEWT